MKSKLTIIAYLENVSVYMHGIEAGYRLIELEQFTGKYFYRKNDNNEPVEMFFEVEYDELYNEEETIEKKTIFPWIKKTTTRTVISDRKRKSYISEKAIEIEEDIYVNCEERV